MIALKLIAQSLAGVVAAAACVGGSVYGITKSSSINSNSFVYYLVSGNKESANKPQKPMLGSSEAYIQPRQHLTNEQQNKEFQENLMKEENQKNYTCKFATNATDDSCILFNITSDQNKLTIELSTIKDFIESGEKTINKVKKTRSASPFESVHFFLLKVSFSKKHLIKTDQSTTITLLSKSTAAPDKGKSYGTLTVHGEITKEKIKGKVNFLIAKVVDEETQQNIVAQTDRITQKCHFKTKEEEKKSCTIFALSSPAAVTDLKQIIFKNITVTPTQKSITLSTAKFFLIYFTEQFDYSSPELQANSVVFVQTTTSSGTEQSPTIKKTELKVEAPIFVLQKHSNKIFEVLIN